jgi:hypothetical protein
MEVGECCVLVQKAGWERPPIKIRWKDNVKVHLKVILRDWVFIGYSSMASSSEQSVEH